MKYINSITKQIETDYIRANGLEGFDSNILLNIISQLKIDLPASVINDIDKKVQTLQTQIKNLWKDYFSEISDADLIINKISDKVGAIYKVDFSSLEAETNELVTKEFRRAVLSEYGFDTIRTRLRNSGLGFSEASTLANTAIAGYDNNLLIDTAADAGIEYFIYDGDISDNTREFCKKHYKRVYTLQELSRLDNKQGLPVDTNMGGYHCQHYPTPLLNYVRKHYGEKFNASHFKRTA